jgi:outer membrane protein OmpA-like peptidoglycan-associated protein
MWLLLAILAVIIILVILLLIARCGAGSSGPPPGTAGAPGANGQAAPAGQPPAAGPPGGPSAAPGSPGAAPGTGAPGADAPGSGAGGAGGDVAAVAARVQVLLVASPVTFRPDRPELTAVGARTVDQVAQELIGAPAARVMVTGYAAPVSQGVGPGAQQLSDQRAAAVAQRLNSDGVDPGRIQTHGAADTNPRASTAASRRAEITVS